MNVAWDYRRGTAADDPRVTIDARFRHGAHFADPAFVTDVVAPSFGLAPTPWEVVHVSYVPSRELRVVYRFAGPPEQLVRVDFTPPGEADQVAARARRRADDAACVMRLAGSDAVAWLVPEDERLPGLRRFLDDPAAAISRALGMAPAGAPEVSVLSYVPRRRAVLRIDGAVPMIAKLGRMRDEGDCHARQVALARRADRGFRMPDPLGYDPVVGVRVESLIDGTSVEHLLDSVDLDALLGGVATAIVALHAEDPVPEAGAIGHHDLLEHLDTKTLGRLTATLPDLARRIAALAERLHETAPGATGRTVLLHGDLHPANLVIANDGPVFIDLDNLATGPPERDLGIFAGRLLLLGLKDGGRVAEISDVARRMPEFYADAGGTAIDEGTFGWYVAASILTRQISNGIRRLGPGLTAIAEGLLGVAEERLPHGPRAATLPSR